MCLGLQHYTSNMEKKGKDWTVIPLVLDDNLRKTMTVNIFLLTIKVSTLIDNYETIKKNRIVFMEH